MNELEERALLEQLLDDESKRDREQYSYTVDALQKGGITPLSIWPESNQNVAKIINKEVGYDSLPIDENNEFHKGGLFTEQQDIILQNWGNAPLCEALEMKPCLEKHCDLYNSSLGPPVCREFKIAFKK